MFDLQRHTAIRQRMLRNLGARQRLHCPVDRSWRQEGPFRSGKPGAPEPHRQYAEGQKADSPQPTFENSAPCGLTITIHARCLLLDSALSLKCCAPYSRLHGLLAQWPEPVLAHCAVRCDATLRQESEVERTPHRHGRSNAIGDPHSGFRVAPHDAIVRVNSAVIRGTSVEAESPPRRCRRRRPPQDKGEAQTNDVCNHI